jgi:hypothetical protein
MRNSEAQPFEWAWQWVFPSTRFYFDRESGERRGHRDVSTTMIYTHVLTLHIRTDFHRTFNDKS